MRWKLILPTVKWQSEIVYLDDVVIIWGSVEEHLEHVWTALGVLLRACKTLKLKKCLFHDPINHSGHVSEPSRLELPTRATNAISRLQSPTNVTERRLCLGFCKAFRWLVPHFARTAALFSCQLEKEQPSHFGRLDKTQIKEVHTLQHRLLSTPILSLPIPGGWFKLDTNARDKQVWYVLSKEQPKGPGKPVGYWTRLQRNAKQSFHTAHRSCIPGIWDGLLLRPYLKGFWITISANRDAHQSNLSKKDATGKLARGHLQLSELDLEVFHRRKTSGSRYIIPTADDWNRTMSARRLCVGVSDNWRATPWRIIKNRRKDWAYYLW